jgi:hypothetical protein
MMAGCIITTAIAAFCAQAQDTHQWEAAFHVSDEDGSPVNAAEIHVFYDVPIRDTSPNAGKITGITDAGGTFIASHTDTTYGLRFLVQKTGYYSTDIQDDFHGRFTPEHLNHDLTIILKKIAHPIPMYAKFTLNTKLPALGAPIGYDLMVGDWIGPYGTGVSTDIIIEKQYSEKAANEYYSKITVKFPNKGDGIQVFVLAHEERGSGLRSPHEAPTDAYEPELSRGISTKPGQPSKFEYDENRVYLFRVHTVLDVDGSVKSALYGKIYGDFMQFRYYLNPTPNDRNIEFDPKQNLLKGLDALHQVSAP